jgi:hypothetical protein
MLSPLLGPVPTNERHARGLAETAIGEADSIGHDELRGCGLMGVNRHIDESSSQSGSARRLAGPDSVA